jgi:hypothetical protein
MQTKQVAVLLFAALIVGSIPVSWGQGLTPTSDGKEFIYLGGRLVAISVGLPHAPVPVSVTPSSGTGLSQSFTYLFSDGNGYTDINSVQIMVNSTLNSVNSCQLYYIRPSNQLYMRNDANTAWIGPVAPGASTTLENSQCIANVASTSVSGTGDNLTFVASLTFKSAFAGAKNNYMVAYDAQATAWQQKGTWTVP